MSSQVVTATAKKSKASHQKWVYEFTELELGVCGEHGGDPESIRFLPKVDADR